MAIVGFLILFPLVAALILLCTKNNQTRKVVVSVAAATIGLASVFLAVTYFGKTVFLEYDSPFIGYVCSAIGIIIALCILAYGIRYKNIGASVLACIQVVGALVFEFTFAHNLPVREGFYLDPLTLLMALVIGIIGSGICVYALGYMEDYQKHHDDQKDRRSLFFALLFLFLSAMFGVIFSNNLLWLFTAWEVTTVCSFLLIGYAKDKEAIRNAFRQIIMNMLGGVAFVGALFLIANNFHTLSLNEFLALGVLSPDKAALPVTCLAFAGITKAAQMPFHTWLLGAMVAPTPTSALLHSSTMVKAGVFLLVKLAPIFAVSVVPSTMVILVGGLTFLLASGMAISQTNAKRLLAYSTIANLGLIVACAGVGTAAAVWAAIFLILFHAAAKSLLFLCVGTAEHHIGSRDIEDMDLLFERMPHLTRYMMLGILCMFIAPFGMLIAKWATLISFVDEKQIILILFLAFGSAATFMFWTKWLGKLAGIAGNPPNQEETVHKSEWVAIGIMAAIVILCCVGLPLISMYGIEPYVETLFAFFTVTPIQGYTVSGISNETLWVASVILLALILVLFFGLGKSKARKVDIYLSGVSANNENRTFISSLSQEKEATARNWYLENIFGEKTITPIGTLCSTLIILMAFVASFITMSGLL